MNLRGQFSFICSWEQRNIIHCPEEWRLTLLSCIGVYSYPSPVGARRDAISLRVDVNPDSVLEPTELLSTADVCFII